MLRIFTSLPVGVRSIEISVSVCLFVCLLPAAVARSFTGACAICYVLPFVWMTSYFHVNRANGQNQRRLVCFVELTRWRHRG